MKTRVISSIFLGIILAIVLVTGGYFMAGVLYIISMIGYKELLNATGVHAKSDGAGFNAIELSGFIAITMHYALLVIFQSFEYFIFTVMFMFAMSMIIYVFSFPRYNSKQVINAIFSLAYAPMMLSFIYLLRLEELGAFIVWVPFVAWICDTFAYLTGRAFGKHKLCPKLSPHKTIEGAIGGVVFSCVAGVIFGYILSAYKVHDMNMIWIFVIITFVGGIVSQIGDLTASGIKRDNDIKDYGKLIPGHGGIMDRFDSVIFVTPWIYLLSILLLH